MMPFKGWKDRGTIRRLDRGADQNVYSSQFEVAAVEMRVLRRQLISSQYGGATASAKRALMLLAVEFTSPCDGA